MVLDGIMAYVPYEWVVIVINKYSYCNNYTSHRTNDGILVLEVRRYVPAIVSGPSCVCSVRRLRELRSGVN